MRGSGPGPRGPGPGARGGERGGFAPPRVLTSISGDRILDPPPPPKLACETREACFNNTPKNNFGDKLGTVCIEFNRVRCPGQFGTISRTIPGRVSGTIPGTVSRTVWEQLGNRVCEQFLNALDTHASATPGSLEQFREQLQEQFRGQFREQCWG